MLTALYLATLFLLVVTLLPLWSHPHWIVRGMDFPCLQFMGFGAILLLGLLVFLDLEAPVTWGLVLIVIACSLKQLSRILPFTVLWPHEVRNARESCFDRRLAVITANVLTPNRDSDRLLALVRELQPDILVTLESDQWWQGQLDVLESDMPHAVKCPLDNLYGMHVYSRLPLRESEIKFLVEDGVPSIHTVATLRTGDEVRLHFLHPAPPAPTENEESAERDAELSIVARSIADSSQPVVVTGDLNDVAWSRTTRLFRRVSGLLDPRVGRGLYNTFHAEYPIVRWPLDHLFHSRHFKLRTLRRLPPIGSDHFALYTELSYEPEGVEREVISSAQDDHTQARAMAAQKGVSSRDVPDSGEKHGTET